MEVNDYIKFANENPISYLATIEGTQPHVRGFQLWYADNTGLYYSSAAGKEIYKQLKDNPKVEICFLTLKAKRCNKCEYQEQFSLLMT